MAKITKLFIIIIFALFISACSENNADINDISWQEEVLFATECGLDGLQCCVDSETPCLYEQSCCVDPNNPSMTYCADDCSFGEPNTFCRKTEPKCNELMVCYDGYCQVAGGNLQPCFDDGTCDLGSVCNGDVCVECGLSNNPCCSSEKSYKCINENILSSERNECQNELCTDCGYDRKNICNSEPKCNPGHLENNGKCLSCGKINNPCCRDSEKVFCEDGLECQSGFCTIK